VDARARIDGLDWWHTIEVAPGVVTPGGWDLRPTAAQMPWPRDSLADLRCLDIGTMDGFWAFEVERRGAAEVVATDVGASGQDAPRGRKRAQGQPRGEAFHVAAELLHSRVEYRELSVYDLDPREVGEFDLVVMGFVLQMLRDPLRALEAIRDVCRGHVIVLDTISVPLSLVPAPVARLSARRGYLEWFVFNRRGIQRALQLTGFQVEATTPILADAAGPGFDPRSMPPLRRAQHALGLLGRSAAVRARAA
jgi:tRNA (mo5U34)-methyltransferase